MTQATGWAMAGGLVAGYGTFFAMAIRYLFPAGPPATSWQYVARVADILPGSARPYTTPVGERVTILRRSEAEDAAAFVGLSSVCPHLGCKVHWEPQNDRFFCPCHNGVFTPEGVAIEGPPAQAGQSLSEYPLQVVGGLLYIEVPLEGLTAGGA